MGISRRVGSLGGLHWQVNTTFWPFYPLGDQLHWYWEAWDDLLRNRSDTPRGWHPMNRLDTHGYISHCSGSDNRIFGTAALNPGSAFTFGDRRVPMLVSSHLQECCPPTITHTSRRTLNTLRQTRRAWGRSGTKFFKSFFLQVCSSKMLNTFCFCSPVFSHVLELEPLCRIPRHFYLCVVQEFHVEREIRLQCHPHIHILDANSRLHYSSVSEANTTARDGHKGKVLRCRRCRAPQGGNIHWGWGVTSQQKWGESQGVTSQLTSTHKLEGVYNIGGNTMTGDGAGG